MLEWFEQLHPVVQALLATLFTWGMTATGAALVFFTRRVNRRLLDSMLGFAGGVMIAASFWSLLAPAIEMVETEWTLPAWVPALLGFLAGGASIWALDKVLPHIHPSLRDGEAEGLPSSLQRSWLLIFAITLHNIPEGLAVGVAFGGAAMAMGGEATGVAAAMTLAVGIGIQNFPEGVAVSMPLRGEGMSRFKAFMFGQASAIVEPIAGVLGALAVIQLSLILPYAYAYAAGAMIYVVVEELIPESHSEGNVDLATISLMLGFSAMMTLDVALG
jgi:ZIP family zinc transporter